MILPNCRVQLTPQDFDFISKTLSEPGRDREALEGILKDKPADDIHHIIDLLLEDKDLFKEIKTREGFLRISPQLFFYVGTRKFLGEFGIDSREIADYIASVLSKFVKGTRFRRISDYSKKHYKTFFSILEDIPNLEKRESFFAYVQMGNYALFISGIFPSFAKRHGGISYYKHMGSAGYSSASNFPIAKECRLDNMYILLSYRFEETRLALNEMKRCYFKD